MRESCLGNDCVWFLSSRAFYVAESFVISKEGVSTRKRKVDSRKSNLTYIRISGSEPGPGSPDTQATWVVLYRTVRPRDCTEARHLLRMVVVCYTTIHIYELLRPILKAVAAR